GRGGPGRPGPGSEVGARGGAEDDGLAVEGVVHREERRAAAVDDGQATDDVAAEEAAALVGVDHLQAGAGVDRPLHAASVGMTTTGQGAWRARCSDTEPSSSRWNPPMPRRPTTRRSARADA